MVPSAGLGRMPTQTKVLCPSRHQVLRYPYGTRHLRGILRSIKHRLPSVGRGARKHGSDVCPALARVIHEVYANGGLARRQEPAFRNLLNRVLRDAARLLHFGVLCVRQRPVGPRAATSIIAENVERTPMPGNKP